VDVELRDLVCGNRACVFNFDGDVDGLADLVFGLRDLEIGESEGAVAEAVAEGVERGAGLVPVAFALLARVLGEVVGVVDGDLADVAGPAQG